LAQARVVGSSSSSGDDRVHETPVEAVAASYCLHRNHTSLARLAADSAGEQADPAAAVERAHARGPSGRTARCRPRS
jgi:hypothetical protein